MKTLNKIIRWPFVSLITLYQKTISPDHGIFRGFFPHGYCRFKPTCSEYTKRSIEEHGVILGTIMGSWRIIRCNPWNHGGDDPVPDGFIEAFRTKK